MSPESYAYWLNGWVELNGGAQPTPEQWEVIKEHLALVFHKVTAKTVAPRPPFPPPPGAPVIRPHVVLPTISPGLSERLCGSGGTSARADSPQVYCFAPPAQENPVDLEGRLKKLQAAEELPPPPDSGYPVWSKVSITC